MSCFLPLHLNATVCSRRFGMLILNVRIIIASSTTVIAFCAPSAVDKLILSIPNAYGDKFEYESP